MSYSFLFSFKKIIIKHPLISWILCLSIWLGIWVIFFWETYFQTHTFPEKMIFLMEVKKRSSIYNLLLCVWGWRHQTTRVIFKNILFSRKMVFSFISMESLIFGLFYWLLYYNFIKMFPFKGDCFSLKMPRPSTTL